MVWQVDPETSIPGLLKSAIAGPSGFTTFLGRVPVIRNNNLLAL
jgi:hypothetical protein